MGSNTRFIYKLTGLLCAGLLFSSSATAADSEEIGTAGALAVMEGLTRLKAEGADKKAGVLVERGAKTIRQAWITRYVNQEQHADPKRINVKQEMISSPEGQQIVQGFFSAYKVPGATYVTLFANTGGTVEEVANIMRGVNKADLQTALSEAHGAQAMEEVALLEGSQSLEIFEALDLDFLKAEAPQAVASAPQPQPQAAAVAKVVEPAAEPAQKKQSSGASWSPGFRGLASTDTAKAPTEIVVTQSPLGNMSSNAADSFSLGSPSGNAVSTDSGSTGSTGETTGSEELWPSYTAAQRKLGINFGTNSTQPVVDNMKATGAWFYNYSPFPNRSDSSSTYDTVAWANKYGKEFVPMAIGGRFKFGAGDESCPIVEYFAKKDSSGKIVEELCDPDEIADSLIKMKKLFLKGNQPRYFLAFNEPYIITPGNPEASNGVSYAINPWRAAYAFTRLQYAAKKAGLKMVTPTTAFSQLTQDSAPGVHPTDWMSMFLKRCYDMRNDAIPCDLNAIHAIAVHDYSCREDYWNAGYAKKGFQKMLIEKMKNKNGAPYGNVDWSKYINSRKIWVTETNCNWEEDFLKAHAQGKYIRTQAQTCLRATGQRSSHGGGSLAFFMNSSASVIERFVWWNTYANPRQRGDQATVTEGSINRIESVRLFDDKYRLTPAGRAYWQAFEDPSKLRGVDCDSP